MEDSAPTLRRAAILNAWAASLHAISLRTPDETQWENESMTGPAARSRARAILTDLHFWLPVVVLVVGLGLLFFVSKI